MRRALAAVVAALCLSGCAGPLAFVQGNQARIAAVGVAAAAFASTEQAVLNGIELKKALTEK